jgi:hypothetical protein
MMAKGLKVEFARAYYLPWCQQYGTPFFPEKGLMNGLSSDTLV